MVCWFPPGICGKWCGRWTGPIEKNVNRLPGKEVALKSLRGQLAGMVSATLVAAFFCSLVALALVGKSGVWLSLAAAAVSLPVGVSVVVYFFRSGVSAESIVAGTLIRMLLTTVLAGLGTLLFEELRVPVFFLALGIIYLANLGVETWFALKSGSSSHQIRTPI